MYTSYCYRLNISKESNLGKLNKILLVIQIYTFYVSFSYLTVYMEAILNKGHLEKGNVQCTATS